MEVVQQRTLNLAYRLRRIRIRKTKVKIGGNTYSFENLGASPLEIFIQDLTEQWIDIGYNLAKNDTMSTTEFEEMYFDIIDHHTHTYLISKRAILINLKQKRSEHLALGKPPFFRSNISLNEMSKINKNFDQLSSEKKLEITLIETISKELSRILWHTFLLPSFHKGANMRIRLTRFPGNSYLSKASNHFLYFLDGVIRNDVQKQ